MSIQTLINKRDNFQMGIESMQLIIEEHADEYLKPTLNYLKEQKQLAAQELSKLYEHMEDQEEQITRLSNI